MATKKKSDPSRFSFTFFKRPTKADSTVIYVRIIDMESGRILAQRSSGTDDERVAAAFAGKLLASLPLEALAKAHEDRAAANFAEAEQLRSTMLSKFFTQFWEDGSPYLISRAEAGKPHNGAYLRDRRSLIKRFAAQFPLFQKTPLSATSLLLLEGFRDYLRNRGVSANVRNDALDSLRAPISWAQKRGLIDATFNYSAVDRPKTTFRKRGVLTDEEVAKIIGLPTEPLWSNKDGDTVHLSIKPRPRLPGGLKNDKCDRIDLRQKVAVLLSELAGLRRGEIRALRWGAIDFERGRIEIVDNYVPVDGAKKPKAGSIGTVPIAEDLQSVLKELKALAHDLKLDGPDNYVLPGARPDVPINEITIARGYKRALLAIGISEEERKQRNLVPHSGRHGFATRLADEIGERAASRLTRHKTVAAFSGYASHTSEALLEKGRKALKVRKVPEAAKPEDESSPAE